MKATRDNINEWFKVENLDPVFLFWYPSSTDDRFYDEEHKDAAPEIVAVFDAMRQKLKDNHMDDNKQVLKCIINSCGLVSVYIGWYDGRISLGWGALNRDGAESHPVKFE